MNTRVIKKLTANDIGDTGGHQSGITIPKSGSMVGFFPPLNAKEFNPRSTLKAIDFHTYEMFDLEYIYYNGKLHGRSTRNEYRLTGLIGFLKKHDAVVGDILHIERDDELFWLSIERLSHGYYDAENLSTLAEEDVKDGWSIAHIDQGQLGDHDFDEEGGFALVLSRRYERSRLNRKVAIELHGRKCSVCRFSFDETYGPLSDGYVEIHHLVPVSKMQVPKTLDPRVDLVPLCANCHRMVHRAWPPLSPEELRRVISTEDA